ncbi:RidA family protein [Anaerocolumna sedimenticola]|uniref:RidA family protein n=1 Tax=Anaerocolumna sedimenticola TaxID=2696063 RepID=A0A6P1TR39_9FIRM|nr:RidA family protein [Anaerocolumna sedimenticola]QHQ62943.1 RidA family protein [Anaerocolumna sedimenticola]
MSDIYVKLKELGLELPKAPAKGGVYSSSKGFGNNLVYISGCGPVMDTPVTGKVGKEFNKDEAKEFAKNSMLNVLAVLQAQIGDLNKVKQAVKILVFVASTDEFYEQPYVANGGSQLLVDLFGEDAGAPSRSAIGVNVLPGNIPVEIEAIFEIKE